MIILAATLMMYPVTSYAAPKTAQMTGQIAKVEIFPRTSALGDMTNMTMITFTDGRILIFQGIIPGNTFSIGNTYTITYDEDWAFKDVKKIK